MANFCMKCGARLQPDSCFCPQCGTAVPDMSKDIKVSEDGRGGLIIDAPEGSTVTVSDPPAAPKKAAKPRKPRTPRQESPAMAKPGTSGTVKQEEPAPAKPRTARTRTVKQPAAEKPAAGKAEKPPVQKNGSGKGPKKALIVVLAAVLGFTAFVKPGFLLDKDKPDYESTTISSHSGGSTATARPQAAAPRELSEEVPEFHEDTGTSPAIDVTVADGVHVTAAAGAFDEPTEITFTPADENDPAVIAADEMLKEEGLYAVAAWEVNAGLADDEQMPGQYDVAIDLDTLDIDPAYYDCLQVVRVNEAGEYYAYRTERAGNTLRYSSNQNSLAFVCIVSGAVLIFAELEYIKRNKYYIQRAGSLKNDVSATDFFKRQVLNLQGSNDYASWVIEWRMDDIDPALADKVARIAQIQAAAQVEAEEYRKTLGIFSRLRENYHVEEYYRQELEGNAEYKRLLKELEMPEIIEYINECIDLSFKYLAEQEKVRMPLHEVPFKIMNKGGDLAHAITRKASLSYVEVNIGNVNRDNREDRDNLLLTITHEAFHICQNMYRAPIDWITDDTRFDEMVVIMVESNAKQWYQDKAYIITDPKTTDINNWSALRLPADGKAQGMKGDSLNRLLINAEYNLGDFLMYLRDECGLKVTPAKMMKARSLITKAATSVPVCAALGISEKDFDQYWRNWLVSRRKAVSAEFYNQFSAAPYKPVKRIIVEPGKEYPVILERDESYFLRLRGFIQKTRNTPQPVLLVPDENIQAVFPEVTLVPAATYYNTKKGVFIPAFVDYNMSNNWLGIMEIHGAVGQAKTTGDAGYTIYAMDQTKKPVLTDDPDNAYFAIQLPELDGLAKKGLIDGWQVTLRTSTGIKATNYAGIEKAGKALKVNYSNIWDKDNPYSPIDVEVTFTEYVVDTKGTKHLGIASETAELTVTPKKLQTGPFIAYDGPVYLNHGASSNPFYDSIVNVDGISGSETDGFRSIANGTMGQPHLTITEDGHFTLTIPALPGTVFVREDANYDRMEVHVSGFSFTGQAVLGYKPRWGYATDKVNTPTEWIAENSQFTISPASVKAENTWVEDKVCGLTWLSNSNGIDEYGRQWHLEEYLETDPAHFDRHYTAKRWRLTVRYRAVAEYSLADGERQFYVGWNEEENRYEFRVSAYMTKHSSFYEDDILINDGNKSYVTTVATGLNGYFYADQP